MKNKLSRKGTNICYQDGSKCFSVFDSYIMDTEIMMYECCSVVCHLLQLACTFVPASDHTCFMKKVERGYRANGFKSCHVSWSHNAICRTYHDANIVYVYAVSKL